MVGAFLIAEAYITNFNLPVLGISAIALLGIILILTVLGGSVSLVETLKCTIVTLVQTPSLMNRKPVTIKLIKNMIQSVDSTLK